jgi:alanine racemase
MASSQSEHDISQISLSDPDRFSSQTRAIIDLDRFVSNIKAARQLAGDTRDLMVIVKANAYGHGALDCALAAAEDGVGYFGVARIDEALQLRSGGLSTPILIIGPFNPAQIADALRASIALTVATEQSVDAVIHTARTSGFRATVHLKIDTGLHRYGALPELGRALARRLASSEHVHFEGLYTHFSSSDEQDDAPTVEQAALFAAVVDCLRAEGIEPPLIHIANSAAVLQGAFAGTNLVRVGIAAYGLNPSDETPLDARFRPVLSLRSTLARRFTLVAGASVSYNRTFTATSDLPAAAVPVGYADGLERHLSNRGWFVVEGAKCPILGRVCMDQAVIHVPESAQERDDVVIIGDTEQGAMTADIVGQISQTNNYETVVGIQARVPRVYMRAGQPYSWSVPIMGERGRF